MSALAEEIAEAEAALAQLEGRDPDEPEVIDAALRLAWALRMQDVGRSEAISAEALERSVRTGHRRGEAVASRHMALVFNAEPDFAVAIGRLTRSRELFAELGDVAGEASAEDSLATLLEIMGETSRAMEHALRARSLAREAGDQAREGWVLSSLGGLLAHQGDLEGGRARLLEGLALFEALGDDLGMGRIVGRLGGLETDAGDLERARAYLDRQLKLARRAGNRFAESGALTALGRVARAEGRLDVAEAMFQAGLDAVDPAQHESLGVEMRLELALVRLERGGGLELRPELERLASLGERAAVRRIASRARLALADLLESVGNHAEANLELRRHIEIGRQMAETERESLRRRMEARIALEAAEKDAEIHRLRFVELEQMQAELVEAEKMALLGQLAAGFAHEVNTPLGVLRSALDVAARVAERLGDPDPETGARDLRRSGRALTDSIAPGVAAIRRLEGFAESLSRFTRVDRSERATVDVGELLQDILTLLQPSLPESIRFESRVQPGLRLECQGTELNRAFMTIVMHAVESVGDEGGEVAVEAAREGDQIVVRVLDDGPALDAAELARVFEVGFDRGDRVRFNLGLSAAAQTVRRLGGQVEASPAEEAGTRRIVHLPAA